MKYDPQSAKEILKRFDEDSRYGYGIQYFMQRIPFSRCAGYRKTHRFRSPQTRGKLDPSLESHRAETCWWCKKTFGEVHDEQVEAHKIGKPPSKDTFLWWLRKHEDGKMIQIDDYYFFLNGKKPLTQGYSPTKNYNKWLEKYYPEDASEICEWIKEYGVVEHFKADFYSAYMGGLGFVTLHYSG